MAGLTYIITALDILQEYPDIIEYIKKLNIDGPDSNYNLDIHQKIIDLLNADGIYLGSSFEYVFKGVQSVLNGTVTRKSIKENIIESNKRYNKLLRQRQLGQLKEESY